MIIVPVTDFPQNSPEWFAARLGNPGGSGASNIVTSKGARSASRDKYLLNLALELKTGRSSEGFSSWKMAQGHVNEQESRNHYEMMHDVDIIEVALCYRDERKKYHVSPDGLIPDLKIGFETKDHSETPSVQWAQYKEPISSTHWIQCQMSLLVTDYNMWAYQSYCQGMDSFNVDVYPDDKFLKILEKELDEFCQELAFKVREIKEYKGGAN